MANQYHAVFEQDGEWWVGYCSEVPGADGQGKTKEECRENLVEAIRLIEEDRLAEFFRGVPPEATRETITV